MKRKRKARTQRKNKKADHHWSYLKNNANSAKNYSKNMLSY